MTTIDRKAVDGTRTGDVDVGPPVLLAPPFPPGPPVAPGPPVPTPAPARASLGRIALWTLLVAVGLLAVVDGAGADVPASAYVAVALAVVAVALVVGSLYGRARWLIAIGAVLTVGLGITAGVEHIGGGIDARNATWKPASVAQLDGSYEISIGDALLDLSAVDFTGRSVSVTVHVGMGDLTVVLPSTVDARTVARVNVGNAEVLGEDWSGIGQSEHVVTDLGPDGAGGGELTLHASVDVGNLEVRR